MMKRMLGLLSLAGLLVADTFRSNTSAAAPAAVALMNWRLFISFSVDFSGEQVGDQIDLCQGQAAKDKSLFQSSP